MQQPELPMKDVTPPKKPTQAEIVTPPAPKPKKESAAAKKDRLKAAAAVKPKKAGTAIATVDAAPREAKSVLAIIADAASNPAINPDNMRALLDMQKEIMADQAKRDFSAAFMALQRDLPPIRRDGKIEIRAKDQKGERTGPVQQATPYATFNNIMKVIKPLLNKHGFELSFSTEPVGERLLVRGLLAGHGHERTTAFPLPAEVSGSKNNVQGWGSSMSYGKRYCTIALLNIVSEAPEDRDTDGEPNRPSLKAAKGGGFVDVPDDARVTPQQRDKIIELMTDAKLKEKAFCVKYGIEQVGFLPASLYDAAVKAIADYKAEVAKRG